MVSRLGQNLLRGFVLFPLLLLVFVLVSVNNKSAMDLTVGATLCELVPFFIILSEAARAGHSNLQDTLAAAGLPAALNGHRKHQRHHHRCELEKGSLASWRQAVHQKATGGQLTGEAPRESSETGAS